MKEKIKYIIEFDFQASPELIYKYFATSAGLSEWFAKDVIAERDKFKFIWEDGEEEAILLRKKPNKSARFRWINDDDDPDDENHYFEFDIQINEMTKDVSLVIEDFAEEDELEEAKMLWEKLIADLKRILGVNT